MRYKLALNVGILSSAILLLSGCTAPGEIRADETVSALDWESPANVLWTNDDVLMSATRVEADVALAYIAMGHGTEFVVARDARTGRELWRRQTTPGTDASGIQHHIVIAENGSVPTTAFLVPTDGARNHIWDTVSVIDIATGEAVSSALRSQVVSSTRPRECLDRSEERRVGKECPV